MLSVPFCLRPGTNDEAIYNSVVTQNEYRLPKALQLDAVVVDIGVHIGSFSHLALTRGAGAVFGDLGLFFAERREAPPLKAT